MEHVGTNWSSFATVSLLSCPVDEESALTRKRAHGSRAERVSNEIEHFPREKLNIVKNDIGYVKWLRIFKNDVTYVK